MKSLPLRQQKRFRVSRTAAFREKIRQWSQAQSPVCLLDSNRSRHRGEGWELLAGTGLLRRVELPSGRVFETMRAETGWLFGYFGYDLKNEVEALQSGNTNGCGLPDAFFFQPETVVGLRGAELLIDTVHDPDRVYDDIRNTVLAALETGPPVALNPRISKDDYRRIVERIREHIAEGDLYEMNFCQEFYAEQAVIDPPAVYRRLNALSEAPFSAYLAFDGLSVMCGSPERFLQKRGDRLVTQPIKGTRRRSPDPATDRALKRELRHSEKDRAENVMIVDLSRNDLSRNCIPGTVAVDELFGVYSFKTVHQMISTVSGTLRPGRTGIGTLREAFPPGSMTGAPKVMAMALIERYEKSRRGIYSGAIGYIDPAGDYDFNVVIRTLVYNAARRYLSTHVGGAIVYDSVPETEYEECLIKAAAMFRAVGFDPDAGLC